MEKSIFNVNPLSYSDDRIYVNFCVPQEDKVIEFVKSIDFIDEIEKIQKGFRLHIPVQQIPEIVRYLERENIAIYEIITE